MRPMPPGIRRGSHGGNRMIRLYGTMRSRATRPLWALYETDTPFELVPVLQAYRLTAPEAADAPLNTRSPAYLQINPQGQVPAMTDGDLLLTESLAIAWYVVRLSRGDLAPQTPQEEAEVLQWALVGATAVEDAGLRISKAITERGEAEALQTAAVQADLAALARPFARIEAALQGRDYLLGARFTIADILLAECCRYAQPATELFARHPALSAWIMRCQARPAFQKIMNARALEPA